MRFLAIIPARFASSRFPGKPLAKILGKPMIQHVYERTSTAVETVVATDDKRISSAVHHFGGNIVMTGKHHNSGTDRCYEALTLWEKKTKSRYDVILNIQGDEPALDPGQVQELKSAFQDPLTKIATLIKKIDNPADLFNRNIPKVVTDKMHRALYFSRTPIPCLRNYPEDQWLHHHDFYRHIGLYGFRHEVLKYITALKTSPLEDAECLEQLRWLENGYPITTCISAFNNHPVDTPEDLERAAELLSTR